VRLADSFVRLWADKTAESFPTALQRFSALLNRNIIGILVF
jgi:hypothetical protein